MIEQQTGTLVPCQFRELHNRVRWRPVATSPAKS